MFVARIFTGSLTMKAVSDALYVNIKKEIYQRQLQALHCDCVELLVNPRWMYVKNMATIFTGIINIALLRMIAPIEEWWFLYG